MFKKMVNKVKIVLWLSFTKECPEGTDKYILGILFIVLILLLVVKHFCNNYNYNNINKEDGFPSLFLSFKFYRTDIIISESNYI